MKISPLLSAACSPLGMRQPLSPGSIPRSGATLTPCSRFSFGVTPLPPTPCTWFRPGVPPYPPRSCSEETYLPRTPSPLQGTPYPPRSCFSRPPYPPCPRFYRVPLPPTRDLIGYPLPPTPDFVGYPPPPPAPCTCVLQDRRVLPCRWSWTAPSTPCPPLPPSLRLCCRAERKTHHCPRPPLGYPYPSHPPSRGGKSCILSVVEIGDPVQPPPPR